MPEVHEFGAADVPENQRHEFGTVHDRKSNIPAGQTPRSARSALGMKILGASYSEIAAALDYASAKHARDAVEALLAETVDESTDFRMMRALATRQLDSMLKVLAPVALAKKRGDDDDPDNEERLPYIREMGRVIDRRIRLQGLDAPQAISIHTPGADEFNQVVLDIARHIGESNAKEGDFEAFELTEGPDGVYAEEVDPDAVAEGE